MRSVFANFRLRDKMCYSYCEVNACADALANMDCEHCPGLHMYDHCPFFLVDVTRITSPRVIVV
jgi:hypothetical protein